MLSRRNLLVGAGLTTTVAFAARPLRAQTRMFDGWPSRPITVISPSGAGGPSANFRLYTEHLQNVFGQPFLLEHAPGASGLIALNRVLRAEPDGHTLLLTSSSNIVLAPLVVADFTARLDQFEPIAMLFQFRFLLLANPILKVLTLDELVSYAKANPGKLSFGSPGVGTGGHLVTELMVKRTGIQAVHVPYKSAPQQMMDTVSGALQFTFDTIGNSRGMVDTGKLVPLAVTGATRSEAAPQVPTLRELGYPGFENLFVSIGLLAKRGTSLDIIKALNTEINRRNENEALVKKLREGAYEVMNAGSQKDYGAALVMEQNTWASVVKEIGFATKG